MKHVLIFILCLSASVISFAQTQKSDNKKLSKQEEKIAETLKLYPTLADKYVNIYVELARPADFVITLVASELNNEKKWQVNAKSSYQHSLDVTQLPIGTYTIKLDGLHVHSSATFSIKR